MGLGTGVGRGPLRTDRCTPRDSAGPEYFGDALEGAPSGARLVLVSSADLGSPQHQYRLKGHEMK